MAPYSRMLQTFFFSDSGVVGPTAPVSCAWMRDRDVRARKTIGPKKCMLVEDGGDVKVLCPKVVDNVGRPTLGRFLTLYSQKWLGKGWSRDHAMDQCGTVPLSQQSTQSEFI